MPHPFVFCGIYSYIILMWGGYQIGIITDATKICVDKSKNRKISKIHTNFHIKCLTVIYWYVNIIYCIVLSNFSLIFSTFV